ncbi:hypothetical protein [Corallococcus carmarthensis]|uniref:hypothetical protein n=1 Tax=Corallococcus carmarthensis TaxID=2316728 RepID=UPI0011C419CA|nr:hypothetical protein [Corallococcus carmarthensis]
MSPRCSLPPSTRPVAPPGAWSLFASWVPYILGQRSRALLVLRWLRFPKEGHATLVASLLAKRSPPTPLLWRTVEDAALPRVRAEVEDAVLVRLRELVPPSLRAVLVADEGFGTPHLLERLGALRLDYVVRVAPETEAFHDGGVCRPASAWAPASMRPGRVRDVRLTAWRVPVVALVCAGRGAPRAPWCLATSLRTASAKAVVDMAARLEDPAPELLSPPVLARMAQDSGGPHPPGQHDRLLLLGALATEMLTLLGAVGQGLELPRRKAARSSPSLFLQGCLYYQALPLMPGAQAHQLVAAFQQQLEDKPVFRTLLSAL